MTTYLRPAEIERVKFTFSMYESEEKVDMVDSVNLPLILRGLNLHPSLAQLESLGVKKRQGEKFFDIDQVMEIYTEMKKNIKNLGTYTDFVEVLKMLDKNDNGKVSLAEISGLLGTLGEPLREEEMDEIMEDCMPEVDDEGDVEFMPFLKALCGIEK